MPDSLDAQERAALLVTGGAGFIGSHVVERLLRDGVRVVVLDNFDPFYSRARKEANIRALRRDPLLTVVEGDVRDRSAVEQTFAGHGIRGVIHLAARPGPRDSVGQAEVYYDVNVVGTLRVLDAAATKGVGNFVLGSSSSVYGDAEGPSREDAPADRPLSPYAATKRAAELLAHTYSHLHGVPVTCLRFFSVYGPRVRPDLAVFKFANLIETGRDVPIFGDGSARRDFTYVSDIVDGILAALATPRTYEIINLADARTIPVLRLVELLEAHLGKVARRAFLPPNRGDAPLTFGDISKARALLGYEPKVTFEEGIARFVQWFRDSGGGQGV
jgi:UDP-glucuronate 4-epimerase